MSALYQLDIETFISEVKKFPELWNPNDMNNKYRTKKQQAWSEIARVFIADFEDMPDLEKMDVYRKLNGKWRNIRDSYVRYTKRKHHGKRGYIYARYLSFLDNVYKNSQSGSDVEYENEEQSDEEEKITRLDLRTGKFKLIPGTDVSGSDTDDTPSTIHNLKRKRYNTQDNDTVSKIEYVDTPFVDASCSYAVRDEDRSFFESLIPAVREFDIDQKLEFRSEVLCLIKNIRSKSCKTKYIKLDPSGDLD